MAYYLSIAQTMLETQHKLISVQLVLLTRGQPHSKKYLIDFMYEFLRVILNLRPVEGKKVHWSDVP